jgi:hypothetical protein
LAAQAENLNHVVGELNLLVTGKEGSPSVKTAARKKDKSNKVVHLKAKPAKAAAAPVASATPKAKAVGDDATPRWDDEGFQDL